ncbi:MAG: hypothetical protein M3R24_29580 [Chloroflexota bacterium]|nr:hypothetical protein [Chloroflexota bacterium]
MLTDVLVLGIGRVRNNYSVAGMTTEPDPITGRRWVRPIKLGLPLTRDDLHYQDGAPIRLGDVVQVDVVEPQPQPPHIENVVVNWDAGVLFIRDLTEARRAAFFPKHVDPEPLAVLGRQPRRSLCLLKPDSVEAVFSYDAETERFEARLMPRIGGLYSEDGIPVFDPFWLQWGRDYLGDKEFDQIDSDDLRRMLGEMYLTLALNARSRVQIIGVHTVPNYALNVDETTL